MGCDIHTYIEIKRNIDGITKWCSADRFKLDPYYDSEVEYNVVSIFDDRDYTLFNALAGVRDYTAIVEYLGDPRGLPEDCCATIATQNEYWGVDGHSHSHCTLQELYDYQDKQSIVTYKCMISPEQAQDLDDNGILPEEWCRRTTQEGYVLREWTTEKDIMKNLVSAIESRAIEDYYLYNITGRIERKYAENTRIVFWFDN